MIKNKTTILPILLVISIALTAILAMTYNYFPIPTNDLSGQATKSLITVNWCQKDDFSSNFKKGTLTYAKSTVLKAKEKVYTNTDSCTGNTLIEYYCIDGNKISRGSITCENGCKDGACLPLQVECIDTDGGINFGTQGTINGLWPGNNEFNEYNEGCSSLYQVTEAYCNQSYVNFVDQEYMINGEIATSGTSCPKYTFCNDGACIPPSCDYYPFNKNTICDGNTLIYCKTGKKTDCLALHGYVNQKKCGSKFQGAAYECLEPCSQGQVVYLCIKTPFATNNIYYSKHSCMEEEYGWFGWKQDQVSSCPQGKKCGAWIVGDSFDYSVCS